MFWPTSFILLTAAFAVDNVISSPAQTSFGVQSTKPKKLHGRFLHITDMHPDSYYTPHTSQSKACHRKSPKKKKNEASYYGTPYSECDSPFRLTNYTLNFLKDNWANEVDFVIWTGDNARHDNDRQLPRTPSEINDLNRAVAARMQKIFTNRGIPVVPSLGNNDVWRPNAITNEFASIWSSFIPFPYLQVFQRGAYFAVEVIPDELAVVSLNTMYFYDSNKVVGGCPYKERNDPGNLQFDWLEVQLKMYRSRGMQYVRYVELSLRFQDTILGHLYGHMNVDHFFFMEAADLGIFPDKEDLQDGAVSTLGDGGLFETLVGNWGALPKSPKLADYAVVNVGPSVVPNPYLPTFRIFSYNVSAAGDLALKKPKKQPKKPSKRKPGHPRGDGGNKTVHCKSEKYRDTWRCHLDQPWHSDSSSPSRSNQRWTPLGYAQYYIPELERANKSHTPRFELEYLTYPLDSLHPKNASEREFVYPVPLKLLPATLRERGVAKSKYAPYRMRDLTIPSWIRLARQVADGRRQKLQKRFRKYMYVGGKEE
ncbi:hypothetical protein GALMADRAFT_219563 [Galerina marginata CBS 339.88]|uniref:Calcineurin-like phosphoesterase domain-containing protein n=1 Tax=Galerina marginata (strain CBS 339.88) TaxID=685588 RepID=A0A067TN20_GALM3|nr:hypothetical protein GALMADRAFT_219563 [Galerina marginata CBS 339.88]